MLKDWEAVLQAGRNRNLSKPTITKNRFKIEERYVTGHTGVRNNASELSKQQL